ncbi:sigma 54-interacting transcriptional regulator [uncultured Aquimarina sp.]|uniref:sigma-54-dependent Fis family transcriptional regulator n=1 Tax=uncultured Aquimarina sp. TaxID=575652 RepID=UPI0026103D3B|nr:sigma 54-interacting transcriptional regulator [uncultured Aquimarina sp.]
MKATASLEKMLLQISKAAIHIRSLDDFYTTVMEYIRPIVKFNDAVLIQISDDKKTCTHILTMSPDERIAHPNYDEVVNKELDITGTPMEDITKRKSIDLFSLEKWLKEYPTFPGLMIMQDTGLNYSISLLLENNDGIFAVLLFHFEEEPYLEKKDAFYEGIKDQLALALGNILVNEAIEQEKKFAETLLRISEATTNIRDRDDLYQTIMDKIKPLVQFEDAVTIVLSEDGAQYNHLLTTASESTKKHPNYASLVNNFLPLATSPIETFFEQEEMVRAYELHTDWLPEFPTYPGFILMRDVGLHFTIASKLMSGGTFFGVLLFHFKEAQPQDDYRWKLYPNIADQLSVAISNVLANEKILEEKRINSILLKITQKVTQIRGLREFLLFVISEIKPIFKFVNLGVFILSEDGKHHYDVACLYPEITNEFTLKASGITNVSHKDSLIAFMMEQVDASEEKVILFDFIDLEEKFPEYYQFKEYPIKEEGYRDCLATNLRVGTSSFGMFCINAKKKHFFKKSEFTLFKSIGEQLSVALDNILANESVLEEKNQKEMLLTISEAATKVRDRETLYHTIMTQIKPIVRYDDAVAAVLSEDKTTFRHILTMATEERRNHPLYTEVVNKSIKIKNSPAEQVLFNENYKQYNVDKWIEEFPDFEGTQLMKETGLNYCIILKLKKGNEVYGFLQFHFKEEQDMTSNVVKLYPNIADQLSVAISNVLANEGILEEKIQKEMLLAISQAATKIRNRETLYHTFKIQIQPIVKYDDATIIIFSKDGANFQHVLRISSKEGQTHPFHDDIFNQLIPIKNTPVEVILAEENFKQYEADTWVKEFPDFKGPQLMKETGITHSTVLKLYNANEVFGLLVFHFKEEQDMTSNAVKLYPNIADQLSVTISNLLANEEIQRLNEQLTLEKEYLEEEIKTSYNFDSIIGSSEPMRQVFEMVEQVASSSSSVIILGETGTGKELIARAIHDRSPRSERPLIKINCATLPAQLLESELFGHEKGSFTGATERRLGKFELAHRGTIFLDEIGELPIELQSKLLRVLQEREIERLGGNRVIKIDTRIITATNRNLEKEVQEGNFRADLFFRLNVFPIILPPLRSRVADIPALASHFLERKSKKFGKKFKGISKTTIKQMKAYHWPGNVRELEHLIERAMITSNGGLLNINLAQLSAKKDDEIDVPKSFRPKTIKDNERALIINTLKHCGGRVRGKNGAAALLDINPSTLESRMRKLGIKKEFVA